MRENTDSYEFFRFLMGVMGVPVASGILGCGGGWWFAGVSDAGRRFGFGCFSARGFLFCGGVPLRPWWIADGYRVLGSWRSWVPRDGRLNFSVLEWPVPHS